MSGRRLLLLDVSSLMYRAFFALPTSIKDPQGNPVNAVRGFLDMTKSLIADHKPDEVIAIFDADWRPEFRVRAYAGYKAQRAEDPAELPRQFEILPEILDAAGIARAEAPGLEADDAIATLLEQLGDEDEALVVTGDRDLLALVRDPSVRVLFTVKGVRNLEEFDEAAVEAKYGIPPSLYPAFATLRGDPSDGLPGVPGVGPKRAIALLGEHGSIEGILSAATSLPAKQAHAFDEARDYLAAMQTVVTLVSDAPIEGTKGGTLDKAKLEELAERHGLGGSARRLTEVLESSG